MRRTSSIRRAAWGLCLAAAALPVAAAPPAQTGDRRCPLPVAPLPQGLDRESAIRELGRLPAACLKDIVVQCSQAASTSLVDMDTASQCSYHYEALLQYHFGGDFQALLAWWRQRPRDR